MTELDVVSAHVKTVTRLLKAKYGVNEVESETIILDKPAPPETAFQMFSKVKNIPENDQNVMQSVLEMLWSQYSEAEKEPYFLMEAEAQALFTLRMRLYNEQRLEQGTLTI